LGAWRPGPVQPDQLPPQPADGPRGRHRPAGRVQPGVRHLPAGPWGVALAQLRRPGRPLQRRRRAGLAPGGGGGRPARPWGGACRPGAPAARLSTFVTQGRSAPAFVNALVWALALVAALAVLLATGRTSVIAFEVAWAGSAGVAALAGIAQARLLPWPLNPL